MKKSYIKNPDRFTVNNAPYKCVEHNVIFELSCYLCVREVIRKHKDHNTDEYWNDIKEITIEVAEN